MTRALAALGSALPEERRRAPHARARAPHLAGERFVGLLVLLPKLPRELEAPS